MLCCLCDLGLSLVILFTEIVYPARESVKNTQDKGSNTQWITYWCIYFSLYLIETITYVLPLIPLYATFKLLFCVWLVHPNYKGASYLYHVAIEKGFGEIDKIVTPYIGKILGGNKEKELRE